ncbi:MAG: hypothetical protein AAF591_22740 [Verrucomicrobiota bacterium]
MKSLKSLLAIAIVAASLLAPGKAAAQGFDFEVKQAEADFSNLSSFLNGSFLWGFSNRYTAPGVAIRQGSGCIVYVYARSTKSCTPACRLTVNDFYWEDNSGGQTNRLTFSQKGNGRNHVFTFWFPSADEMRGKTLNLLLHTVDGIGYGVTMNNKTGSITIPKNL